MLFIAKDPGGNAMLKNLYSYRGLDKIEPTFYNDFAALLKKAGVDMTTSLPLELTMKKMNRVMDEMEKILAKRGE